MLTLPALLAVAVSAWGGASPSCGHPTISYANLSAHGPAIAGWGSPATCSIEIDPTPMPPNATARDYCHLVTHEYGHVLGFGHSTGENIMNPARIYSVSVPACDALSHHHPRRKRRKSR